MARLSTIRRMLFSWLVAAVACTAQQTKTVQSNRQPTGGDAVQQLEVEIKELRALLADMRAETEQYRQEVRELQRALRDEASARSQGSSAATGEYPQPGAVAAPASSPMSSTSQTSAERIANLEEEFALLTGKVDDQYQTKVESASRYRVRFSGLALLNLFNNRGSVNSIDVPGYANSREVPGDDGSLGATLRQSQIGIEVFGPEHAGAHVTADLRFDFAGGFPETNNGVSFGLARLRTGTVALRWPQTSIIAGQDAPFISPLSPSSLVSLAQPDFAYAGNLWYWIPQIRVEHRLPIAERDNLRLQAGLLDPLTGELPRTQFDRAPSAGEASHSPAYALRTAWMHGSGDNPISLAAGGYFSKQDWGVGRDINSWAVTADWNVPLPWRFSAKGEFYRGKALGGLGAAAGHSILTTPILNNGQTIIRGLDVSGGWTQLKFQATPTTEFNVAYGQDNPFSRQLRAFAALGRLDPDVGTNRNEMVNVIYHPRSDLLFSLEYKHLYSNRLLDGATADRIDAAVGVLF
jgi:hypothetical protein